MIHVASPACTMIHDILVIQGHRVSWYMVSWWWQGHRVSWYMLSWWYKVIVYHDTCWPGDTRSSCTAVSWYMIVWWYMVHVYHDTRSSGDRWSTCIMIHDRLVIHGHRVSTMYHSDRMMQVVYHDTCWPCFMIHVFFWYILKTVMIQAKFLIHKMRANGLYQMGQSLPHPLSADLHQGLLEHSLTPATRAVRTQMHSLTRATRAVLDAPLLIGLNSKRGKMFRWP